MNDSLSQNNPPSLQNNDDVEFAGIDQYVPPAPRKKTDQQDQSNGADQTTREVPTPPSTPLNEDQPMPRRSTDDSEDSTAGDTATTSREVPREESIEAQNIFFMLGVKDGTEQEREEFLNDLQDIVWEDFLAEDTQLLLTEEEQNELKEIQSQSYDSDDAKQEAVVVYLDKKIPDLEEMILEKALELKQDIFRERVAGMREYFAGQQEPLQTIDQAEQLAFDEGRWKSAAEKLNQLAASVEAAQEAPQDEANAEPTS